MRQQEHEEAPAIRRRAQEAEPAAAPELRGHPDLRPGAARGQEAADQDPQDPAPGGVRGGADQDDGLPRLPGAARHPPLLRLLFQRDAGLSRLPRRAGPQLGQVYRSAQSPEFQTFKLSVSCVKNVKSNFPFR